MKQTVFYAAVVAGSVYVLGLVATIVSDRVRIWPLWGKSWTAWERWFNYVFGAVLFLAYVPLAYLDWNTFVLPRPGSIVAGAVLLLAGGTLTAAGLQLIGVQTSCGEEGEIRTDGLYRYTRNPQIVGNVIATVGVVLLTNSVLVLELSVLLTVWHLLMPFVEEPSLRKKFGREYEEYLSTTPRFLGVRSFVRLLKG